MSRTQVANILVALTLLLLAGLTVQEVLATTAITSPAASERATASECDSLPSRHSIRTEYVRERSMWITYSEDGATGIDGGLLEILSKYRSCSSEKEK